VVAAAVPTVSPTAPRRHRRRRPRARRRPARGRRRAPASSRTSGASRSRPQGACWPCSAAGPARSDTCVAGRSPRERWCARRRGPAPTRRAAGWGSWCPRDRRGINAPLAPVGRSPPPRREAGVRGRGRSASTVPPVVLPTVLFDPSLVLQIAEHPVQAVRFDLSSPWRRRRR
jgi:hypothetical protein